MDCERGDDRRVLAARLPRRKVGQNKRRAGVAPKAFFCDVEHFVGDVYKLQFGVGKFPRDKRRKYSRARAEVGDPRVRGEFERVRRRAVEAVEIGN